MSLRGQGVTASRYRGEEVPELNRVRKPRSSRGGLCVEEQECLELFASKAERNTITIAFDR